MVENADVEDEEGIGGNGKLFLDGIKVYDEHFDGGSGNIWFGAENDGNGYYSGHVRIYQYESGDWTQRGEDIEGGYGDYNGR